jgi:hypothetical protein
MAKTGNRLNRQDAESAKKTITCFDKQAWFSLACLAFWRLITGTAVFVPSFG